MAINNVNFSWKLVLGEGVNKQLSQAHKNRLRNYAIEKNCDVYVTSAEKTGNRAVKVLAYVLNNNNLKLKEQEIKLKTTRTIKKVKSFWKRMAL